MKVIAVMSQKGGAGKTTLAIHLGVMAHLDGKKVGIIDLDSQGTASSWGDDRGGDTPEVVATFASRLPVFLKGAREAGTDLVVLDVAPRAEADHRMAAEQADLILIPCRPSIFDFRALQVTHQLAAVTLAKPTFVVFNAVAPRGDLQLLPARRALEDAGMKTAPDMIHQRVIFSTSANTGRTAMEIEPDGKGAREVKQLYTWACNQISLSTGKRVDNPTSRQMGAPK